MLKNNILKINNRLLIDIKSKKLKFLRNNLIVNYTE